MSDFVRFHGAGRVNQVQELSTVKGRPFARLWLGLGGDAAKSEGVVRVDFWGDDERAQVLALHRGQRVLVLGRVSGSVNDKGYWNGSMFGDAVFPDGRLAARGAGKVQVPAKSTRGVVPSSPDGRTPSGYAEATPLRSSEESEDIPF